MNRRDEALISVVMPCFNAAPFVEAAVRSVMNQTYKDLELLIVDDGSSDGSQTVLESLASRYPDRITLLHQHHKGPFPARNLALRQAKGRYIAFLDADDYWDPTCLASLHAALLARGADLAYCGWQNIGQGARSTQPHVPPRYEESDLTARFLKSCPWPIHAALTRADIIAAINGFSERCFSAMDYDFWLRILAVTRNITLVPKVLAFYRWHDNGQISAIKWRQVLDAWQVRRDFIQANPGLVAHIPAAALSKLLNDGLLEAGYRAFWSRDLTSSHRLFRQALKVNYWESKDLKYLLPTLLPENLYRSLIRLTDRSSHAH